MVANKLLIEMLSQHAGYDVTTPAGATRLGLDIESATGENLGVNTLKRLTGVIPSPHAPRPTTLDIIARYLGFSSWNLLSDSINDRISGFNTKGLFLEASEPAVDEELTLTWAPDRFLRLRHLGSGRYKVMESLNGKLLQNDILTLSQIGVGFPFIVKEVEREGKSIGPYTAAPHSGLSSISRGIRP